MTELYRYAAFISYSSKDAPFARKLHRALESYGIPSQLGKFDLIGGGKKNRIYPVFRDREELSAGHLGDQIEANLRASAALIVVCSPNGAASPWVQKEIEFFAAQGRHAKIFAIIPDTAPLVDEHGADCTQSCFPPAFRGDALAGDKLEPLAADARKGKDGFRNAWLKIVAGMIGVTPGQIIDRDKRRRRLRRMQLAGGLSAAVLLALLSAAALDASRWRTQLYQRADAATREGRPAEALALALGALPSRFAILPQRDDGADRLAASLGGVRLIADVGPVFEFRLSGNGDRLVIQRNDPDRTGAILDLETGATTELGPLRDFRLSDEGGRLLVELAESPWTWTAIDLETGATTEVLELSSSRDFRLSANGARLFVQRADTQGTGTILDLETGASTELGSFGAVRDFRLSANGATLVVHRADARGSGAVLDLKTGTTTELGPLLDFGFSRNGARLLIVRADARQTWAAFDLATGATTELGALGALTDFRLSANGATLVIQRGDRTGAMLDLGTGTTTELGPLQGFRLSTDGPRLMIRREDAQRTGAIWDLETGAKTELGALGPLQDFALSANGAWLVIWRADAEQTLAAFDLATGAKTELGAFGALQSLRLSANGDRLLIRREDAQETGAMLDLETGAAIDLGPLGPLRNFSLSENGTRLIVHRADPQTTAAAFDVAPALGDEVAGAALTASICSANGHAIRPFASSMRDPAADPAPIGDDLRTQQILRGRPWNPCDWRGLLAIFPNAERGDGWFEGARQWLRLMQVRHFGAADYACEETTSAASAETRAHRRDMCERFASQPGPAAPT